MNLGFKNIFKKLIYIFKFFTSGYIFFPELYIERKGKLPEINKLTKNYFDNLDLINNIALNNNATATFFLQPYNGSGNRLLTVFDVNSNRHICRRIYPDSRNQYDLNEEFYRLVKLELEKRDNFFDLTDVFDNYKNSNEIWFDQVHFSDIGADIIAKKIVNLHFNLKTN